MSLQVLVLVTEVRPLPDVAGPLEQAVLLLAVLASGSAPTPACLPAAFDHTVA
jgi:hypothetical protein